MPGLLLLLHATASPVAPAAAVLAPTRAASAPPQQTLQSELSRPWVLGATETACALFDTTANLMMAINATSMGTSSRKMSPTCRSGHGAAAMGSASLTPSRSPSHKLLVAAASHTLLAMSRDAATGGSATRAACCASMNSTEVKSLAESNSASTETDGSSSVVTLSSKAPPPRV